MKEKIRHEEECLICDLAGETLDPGTVVLVVARQHPLAKKKKVGWADLAGHPWVLPPVGSLRRAPVENALQQHGCSLPADIVESLSVHVITGYLRASDAVGSLSRVAAQPYIDTDVLRQLPLALPDPQRPIGVMWSRHKPASPPVLALRECLRRAAGVGTAD